MGKVLQRLTADRRGAILVEFAMVLPILVFLLLAGVEFGRYVILNQKLDRVAVTVADLAARSPNLTQTEVDNIFAAANEVLRPFALGPDGQVIVSSVVDGSNGEPDVAWQRIGAGTLGETSRVGLPGGDAVIDQPEIVQPSASLIVAEAFFTFAPLFTDLLPPRMLYHRAYFRPRLSVQVQIE